MSPCGEEGPKEEYDDVRPGRDRHPPTASQEWCPDGSKGTVEGWVEEKMEVVKVTSGGQEGPFSLLTKPYVEVGGGSAIRSLGLGLMECQAERWVGRTRGRSEVG